MYIAPGQGQATLWDKILMSTENPYHFAHLLTVKKNLLEVCFLNFFFFFFTSIGKGRQKFYDNRKAFSLCSYVASFKMISSKSDFIHIFNDFIHVYSSRAKAETPWGQTFDVNRKPLPLRPFDASFKQISVNSDFIHIFSCFSTCI